MTDTETEPEDVTPVTSEENVAVPSEPAAPIEVKKKHSRYDVMIKRAISALQAKSGSSKRAITKYIITNNTVDKKHALEATQRGLKRMLKAGRLIRSKNGLFRFKDKNKRSRRSGRKRRIKSRSTKQKRSKSHAKKRKGKSRKGKKRRGKGGRSRRR